MVDNLLGRSANDVFKRSCGYFDFKVINSKGNLSEMKIVRLFGHESFHSHEEKSKHHSFIKLTLHQEKELKMIDCKYNVGDRSIWFRHK